VTSRELDGRIGEIYLTAEEIGIRVRELAAELARDYAGREPLLVGTLKACIPFIADLSMAMPIAHHLDFVALAGYGHAQLGGHPGIRFLKDLDKEIAGRDVVLVDEVVDTGLTLNYLCRTFRLRDPFRPPVPAARRRSADPLRRLHGARRVLRRVRLRSRRALAEPPRSAPDPRGSSLAP
jgi:hypothetical protein